MMCILSTSAFPQIHRRTVLRPLDVVLPHIAITTMPSMLALLALAAPALAAHGPSWRKVLERHEGGRPYTFVEYAADFGKGYSADEHNARRLLFEERLVLCMGAWWLVRPHQT